MMEGYLRSIKDLILPAPNHKAYHLLVNELYSQEFKVTLDRDRNRAVDGLYLKEELGFEVWDNKCSILEMLVALAGRFDGNSGFDPDEVYQNFWMMMDNIVTGQRVKSGKFYMFLRLGRTDLMEKEGCFHLKIRRMINEKQKFGTKCRHGKSRISACNCKKSFKNVTFWGKCYTL